VAGGERGGRTLSTREVARVLGMSEARVRAFARFGLSSAGRGRGYAFSFQDLVVLRAAHELTEQGVPIARVRRAFAALAERLPADKPLSGLRVRAEGRQVTVLEGDAAWDPETGQTHLRLEDPRPAVPPAADAAASPSAAAERSFERALELEATDPAAARAAYRHAIELDPALVEAHVNLGRLLQEQGELGEAERVYRQALLRSPEEPIVHFDLGLVTEDLKGDGEALEHYRRAVELDPEFADAHYNLARAAERLGRSQEAIRHYHAYKRLTE
jgi:tetratricopeptide (TPR) repeat protein